MTQLLHIDSSARGERSHSRRLTREFVEKWQQFHSGTSVVYRDIGRHPAPHVTEDWIAAAFTPPERRTPAMREALRTSDEIVDEFLAADVYVFGVPMYNFNVPSAFKAYIDNVVRAGRTFLFQPEVRDQPYKPMVRGKRMFVIAARGDSGYAAGGANESLNHQDPHLRTVFSYIGVTDITFITVENDEFGGKDLAQSIAEARARFDGLIAAASPRRPEVQDERRA
jgi:FMN-dependent NADH-azoreductase